MLIKIMIVISILICAIVGTAALSCLILSSRISREEEKRLSENTGKYCRAWWLCDKD